MKYTNFKTLALMFLASAVLALTGCGTEGTSTDSGFGDTTPPPGIELPPGGELPPATEITYTDYLGNTRTAAAKPGDAEVLTGTGYQHTLFDTADKKCQHCHNRLYDSWKSSMHSKSWSDKIFQTKQQDFLRTHVAKIGLTKDVEYTTGTFEKVGKTCAKCHAPAAIYSGDFKVTLTPQTDPVTDLNSTEWKTLKDSLEVNRADLAGYDHNLPSTVASIGANGTLYTATYEIGHENNREGINCATCHSIETVRLMTDNGSGDGGSMTLANDIRGNVIGAPVRYADDTLIYDANASNEDMNIFFKLVGPEKYANVAKSPHNVAEYDAHTADFNKTVDGRYTFRGVDKNGTDGKTHYTGGPFYGPFGITGLSNSNEDDDTNRSAQVNPNFDADNDNHFADSGKALCLSCHQRSAGAIVPKGAYKGDFMELCTTWTAVSNGSGTNANDSDFSPKCQKCHMARIDEPMMLHQWAKPTTQFTQADMELTEHFDPDSTTTTGADNPVIGKWMNDHAFIGGNKLGASNYVAKFKSGFDAKLTATGGASITVTTTLLNKTAHMFPAAHPMRRLLTRVTVTDSNGVEQNLSTATGESDFISIVNNVVTGQATNTISTYGEPTVPVDYEPTRVITYQGKTNDLHGAAVTSQKFSGDTYIIAGADGTIKNPYTDGTTIKGTVTNAEIVISTEKSNFTRIYGRETGKSFNSVNGKPTSPTNPDNPVYIVRPGFDSNIVPSQHDNRMQPNEIETYTLTYDSLPAGDYNVTYQVYYMQKGANGDFTPSNPKNMITKVEDLNEIVTVP